MKKIIMLLLMGILFISCSQTLPPRVEVVGKTHTEEQIIFMPRYDPLTKTITTTPMQIPEKWEVTLKDLNSEDLFYDRVSELEFEVINIGDTIKIP